MITSRRNETSRRTWNIWHVSRRGLGQGGIPHVHEKGSLVDDPGAAWRRSEHGPSWSCAVVGGHVLLAGDYNAPRDVLTGSGSPSHW